jgi:hypothetical protein
MGRLGVISFGEVRVRALCLCKILPLRCWFEANGFIRTKP